MAKTPAVLWFRRDLRLSDNPALAGAINTRSRDHPAHRRRRRVGNTHSWRRVEVAAQRFTFET